MEESINQRLKKFVESQSINEAETYKYLGARRQTWYGWLNSEEAIPLAKVQRIIARFTNLNARWLLTGDGKMLIEGENKLQVVYPEDNTIRAIEDSAPCSRCQEKDAEIKRLNDDLLATKDKYIHLLETGAVKKENPPTSGKKVG